VKIIVTILIWVLTAPANFAQAKTPQAQRDNRSRLGLTCAQVLVMSSSDWVAKFTAAKDGSPASTVLAIEQYGKCYDARTDRFAASLGKQGKEPLMGVRGNFGDFESALKNFTAKALEEPQQASNSVKTAYAALYEKQFRYAFYQGYSQKLQKRPSSETTEKSGGPASASPADAQSSSKPDTDPMTLAKNHFGELLAGLPDDKRHEIHAAFGQIFERSSVGEPWKLEIYRYAIFLLEPPSSKPFSAPPF
jgi:hypothetical protein